MKEGENYKNRSYKMRKVRACLNTCLNNTILLFGMITCLLSSTVHAECVPYPPCDSIGYTETSCETQAVKCPFDATKLYCLPCDTKYQYSCNETGQTGSGTACKGKYESCACTSGYVSFCGVIFCS